MSALLTDEAHLAARVAHGHWGTVDAILHNFLRYHATEGREALVEKVAEAIDVEGSPSSHEAAGRVVTALVGEPS